MRPKLALAPTWLTLAVLTAPASAQVLLRTWPNVVYPQTTVGMSVDACGDVDHDDVDDVILGVTSAGGGGTVYVVSSRTGALLHQLTNTSVGYFGAKVVGLGEVDGDGRMDFGIVASGLAALGARKAAVGIGQGAGWAIGTGILIATYSVIDAAGARAMHPIPYIVAMSLGAVTLLSPYVLLRRRSALVHEWRKNGRTIALAATMNLTGYVLVLFAYRIAKTGYVIAAREISIVLSAFVGSVVFREGALGSRLVGAGLILAGVACVAFAR